MAAKTKSSGAKPAKPVTGKVGNYRAPVDTAGMDPEMKKTMGVGAAKPASKFNLRALLKARKAK
jgi:hypothetical protein